jgi:murein L,D-transpeptidase YcbB/YkuD
MNGRSLLQLISFASLAVLAASSDGDSNETLPVPACRGFDRAVSSCPQQLTAEGEAELRAYIDAGELSDLRWPNFENYRIETKEFYNSFCNSLPWIQEAKPTRRAREIIQELKNAENKGLRSEDYDGPLWNERLDSFERPHRPSETALIRFDVALSVSTMRYLSDLHIGRVNPHVLHFKLNVEDKSLDLSEYLRFAIADAQDVHAAIEAVEPQFPAYRRTIEALHTYLELARRDDGEVLPGTHEVIKPGDYYRGVPRLRKLLTLLGDFARAGREVAPQMTYEGKLVDAVKHFQERHGLEANGLIDVHTLEELNTPLSRRVVQLQLTLERWRWLPQDLPRPPIVVNIPEFRLHAVSGEHRVVFSMNVVVGRAYHHQTPVFASEIKSVIFRPYWNVPLEIQQAELLPEIERKPLYLAENAFEIVDTSGRIVDEGVITEDTKDQLRSGRFMLRQKPGPENSLGLLKFEMPNPYDVYLHATPATELFSRSRRDFSHGCIRVEDPIALAVWVLRDEPEWTAERVRSAMNGDETMRVNLSKPVPILVVYGTAVVREDGEVGFFKDIYGHDFALEKALSKSYPHSE